MGLVALHELLPDVAERETRTIVLSRNAGEIPKDEYAFTEWYCVDPGCDCRRVMFKVVSSERRQAVATISYGFDPPADPGEEQLFLDPLHRHQPFAPALLRLFEHATLAEESYRARLERHYAAVKALVANAADPRIRRIRDESKEGDTHMEALFRALADGTLAENAERGTFMADMLGRPWRPKGKSARRARRRG